MKIPILLALAVVLPMELAQSQAQQTGTPVRSKPGKLQDSLTHSRRLPSRSLTFSLDSVPTGGIRVLENALGDVVRDSVLNVLDLLRIRDITIGRPPSPTGYELAKADLNLDGVVTVADLNMIRDILLRKIGVPYAIDSTGGKVFGDQITLTFPPRAVDGRVAISVRRQVESEFAASTGVDTKGGVQDSAYFMTSFEITSSTSDFNLPVGVTVKLDSIPPCAYEGLNGLFAVVPDRDGDGRTDLFLINGLNVNADSLTLTADDIAVPSIRSLSLSQVEPGQPLYITGQSFGEDPQSFVCQFQSTLTDTSSPVRPSVCDDSVIIVTVPVLPAGAAQLTVMNVLTGLTSNSAPLQINPVSGVVSDIRATVVGFYTGIAGTLDSVSIDTLLSDIEDTTVRSYLREEMQLQRASVDSVIMFYSLLPDSLLERWRSFAAFIQNLEHGARLERVYRAATMAPAGPCDQCDVFVRRALVSGRIIQAAVKRYYELAAECIESMHTDPPDCEACEEAEMERLGILMETDLEAALFNQQAKCLCQGNCVGRPDLLCNNCRKTVFVGYGPTVTKVSGGYSGSGGFSTTGCCMNIIRYKRNPCITVVKHWRDRKDVPVPLEQDPDLICSPSSKANYELGTTSSYETRAHPGSVIKVTNALVPYNIVGILNENGRAFIPQVPMNTRVTYSLYDPVTGFYDPDVGTYTTGSEPGGFDHPLLLFRPNTQIKTIPLKTGQAVHESVSINLQRIDFLLNIGAGDITNLFNIGFSANTHLSLKIEDPDGILLFDNSDVACYATAHLRLTKVGTYRVRVALGVSAQAGSFDLGVCYSPDRPIAVNCLCGTVLADSLFFELSPYDVKCSATVQANDTLSVEAGATLQFESGGSVTATGAITGVGTPEKPITLKRAGAPSPGPATANGLVRGRKEVQP